MLEDAVYYSRREAAERGLAQASADPRVRDVHQLLAAKYAELAQRAMAAMPPSPGDADDSRPSPILKQTAGKIR